MNALSSTIDFFTNRNVIIFVLLVTLGSVSYLSAYYSPLVLNSKNEYPKDCPSKIYSKLGYSCDTYNTPNGDIFTIALLNASPLNQFVSLEGALTFKDSAAYDVTIETQLSVFQASFDGTDYNFQEDSIIATKKAQPVIFNCSKVEKDKLCRSDSYYQLVGLTEGDYIFVIKFLDMSNPKYRNVERFSLTAVTYNEKFASYLSTLKIGLFALSIFGFTLYRAYLRAVSSELQSSEQRYLGYLSFVLMLFNQPFLSYNLSQDNFYISVFGAATVSAISALIILYWLALIERLASYDGIVSSGGKTLIKVLALIHFIASLAGYTLEVQIHQKNPQGDFSNSQNPNIELYRYYLYGITALVALWTLIRLFRVLRKAKEFDWRDSTAFSFSLCLIVCHMLFVVTGGLQVDSYKGTKVVLLYGITTLYVLLFQVVYTPFESEIEESEKRRKYETPDMHAQASEYDVSESPHAIGDKVELRNADANKKHHEEESYDEA